MRGEVLERPVLASWGQVLDYWRALRLRARSQSPPSGDPTPSRADVEMTKQIVGR
jgi:hypothetical protein